MRLKAEGWIGRFLRFSGIAVEVKQPISCMEYQEMISIYELEKEEREREHLMDETRSRGFY